MSVFGDGTAKQDLLDAIRAVKDDHDLADLELVTLLLEVLLWELPSADAESRREKT